MRAAMLPVWEEDGCEVPFKPVTLWQAEQGPPPPHSMLCQTATSPPDEANQARYIPALLKSTGSPLVSSLPYSSRRPYSCEHNMTTHAAPCNIQSACIYNTTGRHRASMPIEKAQRQSTHHPVTVSITPANVRTPACTGQAWTQLPLFSNESSD